MPQPITIVFLGSKEIGAACFAYLLKQQKSLGFQVIGVLTNHRSLFGKGATVESLCHKFSIQVLGGLDELLIGPVVDLMISVQYHEILKPEHVAKARRLAVNLHMAPLPEYRGCNQFSFAIMNGDKEFGTTIHRLEAGIDSGDIIAEKRFPIPPDITVEELYEQTYIKTIALFRETLPNLISGNYTLTSQSTYSGRRRSSIHYRREIDHLKQIDLGATEEEIYRRLRATSMPGFPPPYANVGRHKIELILRSNP